MGRAASARAPHPCSAETEGLFDEFLSRLEESGKLDIEEFLRAHPERAASLRALYREWLSIESEIQDALPEPPPELPGATHGEGADANRRPDRAPGSILGDYRLLRLLGEGAAGQVWEAHQRSLDRPVALKLLRPGRESSAQALQLMHEARAAGRPDHPGIVDVYAAGRIDGVAFIAQQLVRNGQTLRERLARIGDDAQLGPTHFRSMAALIADVADALQAAHDVGILHRDLKPGNILIGADGRPRVSDFGLAHVVRVGDEARPGLVGTCAYMSPEQVGGKGVAIDARSDVFGLGAVLFEALTLRRAFEGDSVRAVLHAVLHEQPPDPRLLRARLPPELAVICTKALEKDRASRYGDMAAFADDLRRFLAHKPIRAVPPGLWARLRNWVLRHPAWAASLGLGLAALAAVSLFLAREVDLRRQASVERERARHHAALEQAASQRAEQRARQAEWQGYVANIRAAAMALDRGDHAQARRRLEACAVSLRGWEWWHYALRADTSTLRFAGHEGAITGVAVTPDAGRVATSSVDGTVRVWDGRSGEQLAIFRGAAPTVHAVALARTAHTVVFGSDDGTVYVWDAVRDEILYELRGHAAAVRSVAVSEDGWTILSGSDDGTAHVWDGRSGLDLVVSPRVRTGVRSVAISGDGSTIATASRVGTVSAWDVASGDLLLELPWEQRGEVPIALDRTGDHLLVGAADGSMRVWSPRTRQVVLSQPGDGQPVRGLALTPDASLVATFGAQGVRARNLASGQLQEAFTGHAGTVTALAWSEDGQHLVAGCDDGVAVAWDRRTHGGGVLLAQGLALAPTAIALDADGSRVASAAVGERFVRLWDGRTGQPLGQLTGHGAGTLSVTMSADGRRVASGSLDCNVRLWDGETSALLAVLEGHRRPVTSVALDAAGTTIVSGSYDGTLRVWSPTQDLVLPAPGGAGVFSVCISADGRLAAASCMDGSVFLWNGRDGVRVLREPSDLASGLLGISATGHALAWASTQQDMVCTWDTLTGVETRHGSETRAGHAAFALTPEGSRFISASWWEPDLLVRRVAAPETLAVLPHPGGLVTAVAVSRDGTRLVSASSDGTLRMWVGAALDGAPPAGN